MNLVQPWMLAAGALAGAGVGAAIASAWWGRKLRLARALIDQLQASRRQIEEQVGHARRQIEQLQIEMLELRLTMEHMRRKSQFAAGRAATTDWGESMLSPMSAQAPLATGAVVPSSPATAVEAAVPAARAANAERLERARQRVAAGGFSPTEPMERPMERRATPLMSAPTLAPVPFGFLPTQPHPEP